MINLNCLATHCQLQDTNLPPYSELATHLVSCPDPPLAIKKNAEMKNEREGSAIPGSVLSVRNAATCVDEGKLTCE